MKKLICVLSLLFFGFTMKLGGTTLRDESGWVHNKIPVNEIPA
jgi:hypothetical protein